MSRANGLAFLVILIAVAAYPSLADEKAIPSDFKIIAEYGAPSSLFHPDSRRSWTTAIASDGRVSQEIRDSQKKTRETKTSSLSKRDLRDLLGKVEEAKFFKLDKEYWYHVSHGEILILTVTQNQESHRVLVFAPQVGTENKEVLRFLKVWSEVLRKVPSPNPDQKPDDYTDAPPAGSRWVR